MTNRSRPGFCPSKRACVDRTCAQLTPASRSRIEPLEARIAPAILLNPTTVTYQDVDGDDVTVKLTKPLFQDVAAANGILHFTTAGVSGSNSIPQQLQTIDLTGLAATAAEGVGISITARHDAMHGGDGYADVGSLNATGLNLGTVRIAGDLGRISAGSGSLLIPALKSLRVQSMGILGTATQAAAGSLVSEVNGAVTHLSILGDMDEAAFQVEGGGAQGFGLGDLRIGGSLRGGAADYSGRIGVSGKIGSAYVGGDLVGSAQANTGQISAQLGIKSVTVRGSVVGGGDQSGSIVVPGVVVTSAILGPIGAITIGHNLVGGAGTMSGSLYAGAYITSIRIGGSVEGGAGIQSGSINAGTEITLNGVDTIVGSLSRIAILGDLTGGPGERSGTIGDPLKTRDGIAGTTVGSVSVNGSVIGDGYGSATISAAVLDRVVIGGSLAGGRAATSASNHGLNGMVIGNSLIHSLAIHGSVLGGVYLDSGGVLATAVDSLTIGQDLLGGVGDRSGAIQVESLQVLSIGGSVRSGAGALSGALAAYRGFGKVSVKGSIEGTAASPVQLVASTEPGSALPLAVGSLAIGGDAAYFQVMGGYEGNNTGVDNANVHLGKLSIAGDCTACIVTAGVAAGPDNQFGTPDDLLGSAGVAPSNLASIASITVGGRILGTFAGGDHFGFVAQSIGQLKIGGHLVVPVDSLALGVTGDFTIRVLPA